jgi:N-acetylmuramoyl-L-alanine amidase
MKATKEHLVRNRSSREGGRPKLLVLHTTEGGGTIDSLASWFDNPSSGGSSHIGIDDVGHSIRMVPDSEKAWTQCSYNPYCLSIEQIGFASFSKQDWFKRDKQLKATAQWLAFWSHKYGIPLRSGRASSSTLEIGRSGVVQHKNLGTVGCGHSDCGSGYPQRYVVRLANLILIEHYQKQPNSSKAARLRRKVNRQRKRFALAPYKAPNAAS